MGTVGNKSQATNQGNSQSDQNYDFDINKMYSDYIMEIDAHRSWTNIQTNSSSLNKFDAATVGGIVGGLKVENTSQESRAHAFYRWIGFPVVDSGGNFYNPGFDNLPGNQSRLKDKVTIANNQDAKFKALSLQRENYTNNVLNVFRQTPPTITASALALSANARANTRSFNIPTTNTDPLSFSPLDQRYTADYDSKVGKYDVQLGEYQDANGNTPDPGYLTPNRYHFIQPFIVDARIDFTVSPIETSLINSQTDGMRSSSSNNQNGAPQSSRIIAVPFVTNRSNLLISENTYVTRPLIEMVIRDRIAASQNATISTSQQNISDYILNDSTVKNDYLIQQMVNSPYIKNNSLQFAKYLYMIEAMCDALIYAQQQVIQRVQSYYYWVPLVSAIGPEGGSSISPIIISNTFPSNFVTIRDQAIIDASLTQFVNTFNPASGQANSVPDLSSFGFQGGINYFSQTFDERTSSSLGDVVTSQLDNLNKTRNYDLGLANDALKTIEIIMGEWSGLGLCDIIAVMAALYTMDQTMLLGFLDKDAKARATAQLGIDTSSVPSVTAALTEFVTTVNYYYHLMDDTYNIMANNNSQQ
jgi:hypothetical protein